MKAGGQPLGNISQGSDQGRTKDIIAQKVGLGSGKTLEAAQKVVERGIPELVEAMDHATTHQDAAGAAHEGRVRPGHADEARDLQGANQTLPPSDRAQRSSSTRRTKEMDAPFSCSALPYQAKSQGLGVRMARSEGDFLARLYRRPAPARKSRQ